jgi:hypothetical protein
MQEAIGAALIALAHSAPLGGDIYGELLAVNPKPETRNPKSEIRNPKLETRYSRSEIRDPQSEKLESESRNTNFNPLDQTP